MAVKVNGKSIDLVATLDTLVTYEQQFGTDMVKDVLGKLDVSGVSEEGTIDFSTTNWTACSKALWAFVKSDDPSTPGFKEWSKKADLNLMEVAPAVGRAVMELLFRPGAADSD